MKAPYPFFGGKRKIAADVWQRFGDVKNYVESFAGSLAVLLERPSYHKYNKETVNDLEGFIANFWRAVSADPDAVAHNADWPVNENDMHARHYWLVNERESLTAKLEGDPAFYDAKIAGWWVWGISIWIGGGWCSGNGPWHAVETEDGRILTNISDAGRGVHRQRVHLSDAGQGVHRQRVHLGSHGTGNGVVSHNMDLTNYMRQLSDRLRRVRVASGDWSRICGPSVTFKHGLTAVFLDPPYADEAKRADGLYAKEDTAVSHQVREWALANGDNPLMRIALCGYEREHGAHMPDTWEVFTWKANGGYNNLRKSGTNDNAKQERVWFSPHCLKPDMSRAIVDNNDYSGLFEG